MIKAIIVFKETWDLKENIPESTIVILGSHSNKLDDFQSNL